MKSTPKTIALRGIDRVRPAVASAAIIAVFLSTFSAMGHIIPPEDFHPAAESYRRAVFLLNLNPIQWDRVSADVEQLARAAEAVDGAIAEELRSTAERLIPANAPAVMSDECREAAQHLFEALTQSTAALLNVHLRQAANGLSDYHTALGHVGEARQIFAAFEHEVQAADPEGYKELGGHMLEMTSALGSPGVLGVGGVPADPKRFNASCQAFVRYVDENFGAGFRLSERGALAALPLSSPTYVDRPIPVKLPPGHEINKQVPRPRQVLNMAARGVDESDTPLIALGDMAFDSAFVFGEPARSINLTCNTCHNKGVTNPQFFIPGLSDRPGSVDVSSSYFAPHANNGHFDAIDIPDLRGIRYTAPYGRNGRFPSLREFVRNGIMHEFNGAEPDPLIVDAMLAYMNEFDFLPNPYLNGDGTMNETASEPAKRGEALFRKPFAQMDNRSCASCHVPSDFFLDRKRHNIGTVEGAEPYSLDRALDTPTLINAKYTAPYFHDGSMPTLRAVNEWFNETYELGLSETEIDDLTAYVELVGEGEAAYEDTPFYLDAEMEEFSFFLSTYEYLKRIDKPDLMDITFRTIASEIRNHKWELQNTDFLPVMEKLAELMDEASEAVRAGDRVRVAKAVHEYRTLYDANVENLQ